MEVEEQRTTLTRSDHIENLDVDSDNQNEHGAVVRLYVYKLMRI
jgi:hypothetical protein